MAHLRSLAAPEPANDGWQDIYDHQGQFADQVNPTTGEYRDRRRLKPAD